MKKKIHQLHCRKVRGRWSHCHFGIQDRWKKQICFFVHVSQQEAKTKCSALGSGLPGILSELIQFACGAGGGPRLYSLESELGENLGTSTSFLHHHS